MKPATGLAAALMLALSGCAGTSRGLDGGREVSVEAEGWAPLSGDSLWSAKQRALAEAQKKAVEKAVGVTVRASTRVDEAVSIRQSIEANLGGTIRRYDVLSERVDDGFMKVAIRAVVYYRPHAHDMPGLKPTRFRVKVADDDVAAKLRSELAAYDFPLADSDATADVVVNGVVETYGRADPRLGGFHSYRAKLTLSVLEVRSGKVQELAYEGTGIDPDDRTALQTALEQAASASGMAIAGLYNTTAVASTAAPPAAAPPADPEPLHDAVAEPLAPPSAEAAGELPLPGWTDASSSDGDAKR